MRVIGEGATTTDLEYYGEAEPRLMKLREAFREKKLTKDQVWDACVKLVGRTAIQNDMNQFEPMKGSKMVEFINWQLENPLRPRLYGSAGVVASLVVAAPDATEVRIPREWLVA